LNITRRNMLIGGAAATTGALALYLTASGIRFPDATVSKILIVSMGQSNDSGRAHNNQVYTSGVQPRAKLFGNDYMIRDVVDPTDDSLGQLDVRSSDMTAGGSIWPLVLSRMLDFWNALDVSIPEIVFVPCSRGGTSIRQWLPGKDRENRSTLYGSCIHRARRAGAGQRGVLTVVERIQGESDAIRGTSSKTYQDSLELIAQCIWNDLGANTVVSTFPRLTGPESEAGQTAIVKAIRESWDHPNILRGANLQLLKADPSDNLHLKADMVISAAADKVAVAMQAAAQMPVGLLAKNILPLSNQFSRWGKVGALVISGAAPSPSIGTETASLMISSGPELRSAVISPSVPVVSGARYTASVYAKRGTGRFLQLYVTGDGIGATEFANFDLKEWIVTTSSGVQALMEAVDGHTEWYRCQISFLPTKSDAIQFSCCIIDDPLKKREHKNYEVNGETIHLYAAQIELRQSAGPCLINA
jgi:hypothetical protein